MSAMMRSAVRPGLSRLVLVALMAVSCAGPDTAAPSRQRSRGFDQSEGAISARVVLPAGKVAAGAMLPGDVVVENGTGRALNVSGCGSPFAVVLANDEIRPDVAWPSCLERITIPAGTSRWPVTVAATYSACAVGGAETIVPCEDGETPPLPVGNYHAVLVQNPRVVPKPPPMNIRVVRCGCAL